jgi:hypothetical protein
MCVDLFETLAQADGPPWQVLIDPTAVKLDRCADGGKYGSDPAAGRSRRGRRIKINALTDCACRALIFVLTSGQAGRLANELLLERVPARRIVWADKG